MNSPSGTICIVIPCYNEEGNIGVLYQRIVAAFATVFLSVAINVFGRPE